MEEELTDLLLEAAGRTNTGGRNRPPQSSRRHHKSSYSDDGSDSRDDDSDDGRGYSGRKLSGSQVPLKKRLDPQERDDDHSSHGEGNDGDGYGNESDDDSIGSDLYKDDDDRQKLAQMTELEREMILTDRAAKKSDRSLHDKMIKDRAQPRKQSSPPSHSRGMRSSTRALDRAADRDDALNEIRAKRARQQQDPEGQFKLRDAARKGSGGRGYSPIKRRSFTAATLGSSPTRGESDSHSNEGDSSADDGMDDSDDDKSSPESQLPTFEDIKEISIRRSKLAKWFMEPFFDELIVGCFVRVGIGRSRSGPIYRLCVVRNVDSSDPNRQYKLENKTTSKFLNVVWGNENSAARWQMAMVSDSPPLRDEFDQWVREVERSGGRMPSKQDVLEKKEAIQKSNTFVYSADTVKQMLQQKKSATWRPLNVAAEKDRLRRDMEVAKMKNDEAEVERIKARLQELDDSRKVQEKDDKARRLAEMNRKNRVENFKNASELRPVNQLLKAGQAGYDPFSRRWTRSTNYFAKGANEEAEGASNGEVAAAAALAAEDNNGASGTADGGMAATAAALQAAAGAGKLVDTNAPVDQGTESNTLHDFDLPISLAVLQKFGGSQGGQAGFMARKQRIEATVGCSVPENDGRRHALTLSVSDYKRRRGLL
ncbi:protein RTF1 homolog [Solanum tuberosum]|uniref:RNA polymerase-associated protein RTF1 n=1 Tax=Solanum tuberosum TaxID=4113 RepID=M1C1N5_SOLTU|nr:PREDICTED: protein RTF1 homolog [Solanum tuberosum]XP_015164153.1 PREDICTED: protein RTF1 homolog [Solanum tuberosum]XP_015164154.1 PREDICTED: protein RTF1 homolog [Solanum tuberosum]